MLVQKLWRRELDWDDPVDDDMIDKWEAYLRGLVDVTSIRVSRAVKPEGTLAEGLIAFTDVSLVAQAAVVYMRADAGPGRWSSQLLCAKAKVSPPEKAGNSRSTGTPGRSDRRGTGSRNVHYVQHGHEQHKIFH